MTDIPEAAAQQPDEEIELDWKTLMELINTGATRTVFWHVAELLDNVAFLDSEVEALLKMPLKYRQTVAASLIDYAETIREASRDLDAQLMRLTGELV